MTALRDRERLLISQQSRVLAAAERLDRQPDPSLRAGLVEELRLQEELLAGLARGVETLRERVAAEKETARTRAFFSAVENARAERVAGDERRALLREVRSKLRPRVG